MKRGYNIGSVLSLMVGVGLCLQTASLSALSIGVVNAKKCVDQSKIGKTEQGQFDQLRKQLEQSVASKEKELNDLKPKLSDEFLDTQTPEAERQIKERFQMLQQEHQELYYNMSTMLNKANYELMQKLLEKIQEASRAVADRKKLDIVMNEEACFYKKETLDVTNEMIEELDKIFDSQK